MKVLILLLFVVAKVHYPTEFPHISFMGQTLPNHSFVDLDQVGNDRCDPGNTVKCHTNLCTCCSDQREDSGQWVFPNKNPLPVLGPNGMLFNDQRIDLFKRSSMPSGIVVTLQQSLTAI